MRLTSQHVPVSSIRDGKEMRRNLVPSLPKVEPDGSLGVDRVSLVRIDSHAEQTRVGLKERFTSIFSDFQ